MIDDRLRSELGALLDGALPDEQAVALRLRLASDAELRREYEELERTVAAVRGLPRAKAPDDFRAAVRARVAAPPPVHRGWFTGPRFAAAAAVLLAASLMFYVVRDKDRGVTREPDEARAAKEEARAADKPAAAGRADDAGAHRDDVREVDKDVVAEAPDAEAKANKLEAALGKPAAESEKGARAREESEDLVRLAEADRTKLAANRVAYLEQLSRLPQERLQSHVYAFTQAADAKALSLRLNTVTVDAGNAVEAARIAGVLRGWAANGKSKEARATEGAEVGFSEAAGAATATGFVRATVRATPEEMRRIATWLTFVSVAAPGSARPAPAPGDAGAGGGAKKSRRGGVDRKSSGAPQRRDYRIVIRYPQPPPTTAPEPDKR